MKRVMRTLFSSLWFVLALTTTITQVIALVLPPLRNPKGLLASIAPPSFSQLFTRFHAHSSTSLSSSSSDEERSGHHDPSLSGGGVEDEDEQDEEILWTKYVDWTEIHGKVASEERFQIWKVHYLAGVRFHRDAAQKAQLEQQRQHQQQQQQQRQYRRQQGLAFPSLSQYPSFRYPLPQPQTPPPPTRPWRLNAFADLTPAEFEIAKQQQRQQQQQQQVGRPIQKPPPSWSSSRTFNPERNRPFNDNNRSIMPPVNNKSPRRDDSLGGGANIGNGNGSMGTRSYQSSQSSSSSPPIRTTAYRSIPPQTERLSKTSTSIPIVRRTTTTSTSTTTTTSTPNSQSAGSSSSSSSLSDGIVSPPEDIQSPETILQEQEDDDKDDDKATTADTRPERILLTTNEEEDDDLVEVDVIAMNRFSEGEETAALPTTASSSTSSMVPWHEDSRSVPSSVNGEEETRGPTKDRKVDWMSTPEIEDGTNAASKGEDEARSAANREDEARRAAVKEFDAKLAALKKVAAAKLAADMKTAEIKAAEAKLAAEKKIAEIKAAETRLIVERETKMKLAAAEKATEAKFVAERETKMKLAAAEKATRAKLAADKETQAKKEAEAKIAFMKEAVARREANAMLAAEKAAEAKKQDDAEIAAEIEAETRRAAEKKAAEKKAAEAKLVAEKETEANRQAEARIAAEKAAAAKLASEKEATEAKRQIEATLAAEKAAESKKQAEAKIAAEKEAEAKIAAEKEAEAKLAAEKEAEVKLAAEKEAEAKLAAEKEAEAKLAAEKQAEAKKQMEAERSAEKEAQAMIAAEKEAAEARLAAEKKAAEAKLAALMEVAEKKEAQLKIAAEKEAEARLAAEKEAEAKAAAVATILELRALLEEQKGEAKRLKEQALRAQEAKAALEQQQLEDLEQRQNDRLQQEAIELQRQSQELARLKKEYAELAEQRAHVEELYKKETKLRIAAETKQRIEQLAREKATAAAGKIAEAARIQAEQEAAAIRFAEELARMAAETEQETRRLAAETQARLEAERESEAKLAALATVQQLRDLLEQQKEEAERVRQHAMIAEEARAAIEQQQMEELAKREYERLQLQARELERRSQELARFETDYAELASQRVRVEELYREEVRLRKEAEEKHRIEQLAREKAVKAASLNAQEVEKARIETEQVRAAVAQEAEMRATAEALRREEAQARMDLEETKLRLEDEARVAEEKRRAELEARKKAEAIVEEKAKELSNLREFEKQLRAEAEAARAEAEMAKQVAQSESDRRDIDIEVFREEQRRLEAQAVASKKEAEAMKQLADAEAALRVQEIQSLRNDIGSLIAKERQRALEETRRNHEAESQRKFESENNSRRNERLPWEHSRSASSNSQKQADEDDRERIHGEENACMENEAALDDKGRQTGNTRSGGEEKIPWDDPSEVNEETNFARKTMFSESSSDPSEICADGVPQSRDHTEDTTRAKDHPKEEQQQPIIVQGRFLPKNKKKGKKAKQVDIRGDHTIEIEKTQSDRLETEKTQTVKESKPEVRLEAEKMETAKDSKPVGEVRLDGEKMETANESKRVGEEASLENKTKEAARKSKQELFQRSLLAAKLQNDAVAIVFALDREIVFLEEQIRLQKELEIIRLEAELKTRECEERKKRLYNRARIEREQQLRENLLAQRKSDAALFRDSLLESMNEVDTISLLRARIEDTGASTYEVYLPVSASAGELNEPTQPFSQMQMNPSSTIPADALLDSMGTGKPISERQSDSDVSYREDTIVIAPGFENDRFQDYTEKLYLAASFAPAEPTEEAKETLKSVLPDGEGVVVSKIKTARLVPPEASSRSTWTLNEQAEMSSTDTSSSSPKDAHEDRNNEEESPEVLLGSGDDIVSRVLAQDFLDDELAELSLILNLGNSNVEAQTEVEKPAPRESRMNDFLNRLTAGFWRFNGPGSTTDEEAAGVEEKTLMLFDQEIQEQEIEYVESFEAASASAVPIVLDKEIQAVASPVFFAAVTRDAAGVTDSDRGADQPSEELLQGISTTVSPPTYFASNSDEIAEDTDPENEVTIPSRALTSPKFFVTIAKPPQSNIGGDVSADAEASPSPPNLEGDSGQLATNNSSTVFSFKTDVPDAQENHEETGQEAPAISPLLKTNEPHETTGSGFSEIRISESEKMEDDAIHGVNKVDESVNIPPQRPKSDPSLESLKQAKQMRSRKTIPISFDLDSIPTISSWIENPDKSITGIINNSPDFESGEEIMTAPIREKMEKPLNFGRKAIVVTTVSGSRFRLVGPSVSPDDNAGRFKDTAPMNLPPGYTFGDESEDSWQIKPPARPIGSEFGDFFSGLKKPEVQKRERDDAAVSQVGPFTFLGQGQRKTPEIKASGNGKTSATATVSSRSLSSMLFGSLGDSPKIPTLSNWEQNKDGSITGYVFNRIGFRDGTLVTTSPIKGPARPGRVITTTTGSKYRLE